MEYYFKLNLNNNDFEEALTYLIQRVIYEVNVWYMKEKHYSLEFAISFKTSMFFEQLNHFDIGFDLEGVYNRTFNGFKFGHMKNYKDKIFDYVEILLDGHHFH